MSVFADTQANDVRRIFLQQFGIAFAFLVYRFISVQIIYVFEGHHTEDGFFQKIAEALRSIFFQVDIFVHVKGIDAFPFYLFVLDQCFEKLGLRRCRREDHVDGLVLFQ